VIKQVSFQSPKGTENPDAHILLSLREVQPEAGRRGDLCLAPNRFPEGFSGPSLPQSLTDQSDLLSYPIGGVWYIIWRGSNISLSLKSPNSSRFCQIGSMVNVEFPCNKADNGEVTR
jgi:hypothetical protein